MTKPTVEEAINYANGGSAYSPNQSVGNLFLDSASTKEIQEFLRGIHPVNVNQWIERINAALAVSAAREQAQTAAILIEHTRKLTVQSEAMIEESKKLGRQTEGLLRYTKGLWALTVAIVIFTVVVAILTGGLLWNDWQRDRPLPLSIKPTSMVDYDFGALTNAVNK